MFKKLLSKEQEGRDFGLGVEGTGGKDFGWGSVIGFQEKADDSCQCPPTFMMFVKTTKNRHATKAQLETMCSKLYNLHGIQMPGAIDFGGQALRVRRFLEVAVAVVSASGDCF